jgi:two-component system response regulator RegA
MKDAENFIYVEDDAVLAAVTVRALCRRGFGVDHFTTVKAAREACQPAVYDCALLDLKLEDGSSLELIEYLLQQNPGLKIVVLTGYASIASAVQAIKLGATNYLTKPATIEQILNAFCEDSIIANDSTENLLPLRRVEWEHIQQALADNSGNISATARQLKMHRRTLQRKLSKKPVAE